MGLMGIHNLEHDFCGISNAWSAVSEQLGGRRVLSFLIMGVQEHHLKKVLRFWHFQMV